MAERLHISKCFVKGRARLESDRFLYAVAIGGALLILFAISTR